MARAVGFLGGLSDVGFRAAWAGRRKLSAVLRWLRSMAFRPCVRPSGLPVISRLNRPGVNSSCPTVGRRTSIRLAVLTANRATQQDDDWAPHGAIGKSAPQQRLRLGTPESCVPVID